jgi:hypothetical protein
VVRDSVRQGAGRQLRVSGRSNIEAVRVCPPCLLLLHSVHGHFEILVLAIWAQDSVDHFLDGIHRWAFPHANSLRMIVRRAVDGKFERRRHSLSESSFSCLLKPVGILDAVNGDSVPVYLA